MSLATGNPLVTCRTRRGYNRQSGKYVEYQYEGVKDSIYGMLGELATADNWELDHDGNRYTLKVRYATAQDDNQVETPIDEVRLHANRSTASIYSAPAFQIVPAAFIRAIRRALQNPEDTSPGLANVAVQIGVAPDSDEVAAGYKLYNLLLDGVEHFVRYQPVLVRVFVASSEFSFTAAYDNVGSVLTNTTLASDANVNPAILKINLPTSGATSGGVVHGGEAARAIYKGGWLKHFPEYTWAAGNKGVFSQEYEFGLWSTALYGEPI